MMNIGKLFVIGAALGLLGACGGIQTRTLNEFTGMNIFTVGGEGLALQQREVTLVATALDCDAGGFATVAAEAGAFDSSGVQLPDSTIGWRLRQDTAQSSSFRDLGTGGTIRFRVDCANVPRTSVVGPIVGHAYTLIAAAETPDGDQIMHGVRIDLVPLPQ